MRAAWIGAWGGTLELGEAPDPEPGPGEVLIRVESCGIGLTVVNCMAGQLGADPAHLPRVPGHELVGTVEAVGAGVPVGRVGERVTAYFYLSCGTCERCLAGAESLCRNFGGNVGVACDGGFAELVRLPQLNALALAGSLDPVEATVIPDATATPVHVARRASIGRGERVAVVGAGGGLGIHMVQVARAFGAEVLGLDVAEEKLSFLADELGVHAASSSSFDAVSLPDGWGGKADVVVDFLGRKESSRWALEHLDSNGRLVCLTSFRGIEFPVASRELVAGQLSVLGVRYASRHDVRLAAELVATGKVRPVISRRVGLEEVPSVVEDLRRGTLLGRGALVW